MIQNQVHSNRYRNYIRSLHGLEWVLCLLFAAFHFHCNLCLRLWMGHSEVGFAFAQD
jgi:hypothetical protein